MTRRLLPSTDYVLMRVGVDSWEIVSSHCVHSSVIFNDGETDLEFTIASLNWQTSCIEAPINLSSVCVPHARFEANASQLLEYVVSHWPLILDPQVLYAPSLPPLGDSRTAVSIIRVLTLLHFRRLLIIHPPMSVTHLTPHIDCVLTPRQIISRHFLAPSRVLSFLCFPL